MIKCDNFTYDLAEISTNLSLAPCFALKSFEILSLSLYAVHVLLTMGYTVQILKP